MQSPTPENTIDHCKVRHKNSAFHTDHWECHFEEMDFDVRMLTLFTRLEQTRNAEVPLNPGMIGDSAIINQTMIHLG